MIKNIFNEIRQNQYFLFFIFLFGYAQSIQIRFLIRRKWDWFIFTPEAAVASFISACMLFVMMRFLIKKWQKSDTFSQNEALKIFSTSLILYLLTMTVIGLFIALLFDTVERNFNTETLTLSMSSNVMDALIYGSFFLAYHYYQKNLNYQKQITSYNQALSDSKINQLKNQLNPHFLFNNLNVLDQFIEEDKHKASDFLNEFAEIYRYVLLVTDKKIVSIKEELSFAKSYFALMQHKYANAYLLEIEQNQEVNSLYIVPLTLQLLIENAIGHNLGTASHPVVIKISIGENILVSNNIIKKRNLKTTSGRGLLNIKGQYDLLSKQGVEVMHSKEAFSVTLPLIQAHKND